MDIGCGDGFFISTLSKEYPNLICIGVDINFTKENLISLINQGLYSGIIFLQNCCRSTESNKECRPDSINGYY